MSALRRVTTILLSSRTLMLGALAAGALAGWAFLSPSSPHQVVANFVDADGLVAGNEIRVAGLQSGGTVDSIGIKVDQATGKQYAVVTLDIDDSHWPLHQGTRFAVRPKGVLSNVYVAMYPGQQSGPALESGHIFGVDQTDSPINLDAFSNLFTADVRESIRTQIQEGMIAFGGSGADNTNGLLQHLNPLSADLSPVTAVLAQRSPELDRLNVEFDTITADLSREDANLRGLISNGNTLLATIADHATSLQGTLVHAAGTLSSIDQGLQGEESNLQAIFEKSPAALDSSALLASNTNPVLSYINPHVAHLDQLLGYFLSATGYSADGSNGVLGSRIDASLYIPNSGGKNAIACGGQQWKTGPNNAGNCPKAKPLTPPDAGASSFGFGPFAGTSAPQGGSAAGSSAGASPGLQLFGGLFQ